MQDQTTLVDRFTEYLRDTRHASPYTARCYEVDLDQFIEYLAGDGDGSVASADRLLLDVSGEIAAGYLAHLKTRRYSPATVARKLATLRSFYKWLLGTDQIKTNPMQGIRSPKFTRQMPKVLSEAQIDQLMSTPDNRTVLGARDRAILEIFYACGLRVGEVVNLERRDLDMNNMMTLRVRTVGKRDRLAPLNADALAAVRHYLNLLDPRALAPYRNEDNGVEGEMPLFVNKNGGRLSTRSVRRKLDKYLRAAKLDMDISPHTLRHSFAMHQLGKGSDLKELQQQLGHRALATTQIYRHMAVAQGR